MRKIPPYGKELYKLQQQGQRPTGSVYVWIGNYAWKKGQAFSVSMPNRTLALPPWVSPGVYDWPVKDCDVLIHDTGFAEKDYLEDLVYCLYKDGTDKVRLIAPDFKLTIYHKD